MITADDEPVENETPRFQIGSRSDQGVIVINFSHPLTAGQIAQIEAQAGKPLERVLEEMAHFMPEQSFGPQAAVLVDRIGLTPGEWQTLPLLVRMPALSEIAGVILAELHGRMGYFPPVLRLRAVAGSLPPVFEVAEIINLQAVRDQARASRLNG